jgi:hypothetical protein
MPEVIARARAAIKDGMGRTVSRSQNKKLEQQEGDEP